MAARNRGGNAAEVVESAEVVEDVESSEDTIMVSFSSADGLLNADAHVSADGVFSTTDLNNLGAAVRAVATQKADRQSVVIAATRTMMVEAPTVGDSMLASLDAIVEAAKAPRTASGPRTTEAERNAATVNATILALSIMMEDYGIDGESIPAVPDSIGTEAVTARAAKIIESATFALRERNNYSVLMEDVVSAGLMVNGEKLTFPGHSAQVTLNVADDGTLSFSARGRTFSAASPAAQHAAGLSSPVNGLDKLRNADGVVIGKLRDHPDAIAAAEARESEDDSE